MGIFLDHSEHHFNKRIFFVSFLYSLTIISYSLYFIYDANTFWEYTNSIYSTTTFILNVTCFAIIILQLKNLFEFIEKCEKIVHKSQSQATRMIYDKTNRQIEKWSKIVYLAVSKFTPICMILPQCISFVLYLTTDLGTDAFDLSLPMW